MAQMQQTRSLSIFLILTVLLLFIGLSISDQFAVNEQIPDIPPQFLPPLNDGSLQQILEGRGKWIEPNAVRQPKVDVKFELNRLNSSHEWDSTWPTPSRKLGAVSAVSFDNAGNVMVFHRGDHVWDGSTFNNENIYIQRESGPIADNAIVAFNRQTGAVAYEWASNMFYMPHGLTVDHEDNVWITDVALHQVMKFNAKNRTHPELVLGIAFQPGSGQNKYCKPTSVAVLPDGDFFVADGYCNSRIIKYSKSGEMILKWGKNSFQGIAYEHAPSNFFAIPHALTLASDLNLLCVADRENGRVQCFHTKNGTFHSQYHSGIIGDRLFSVAYAPINGGQLYVVNGPQNPQTYHEVSGFVIDMKTQEVISKFGSKEQPLENPHDIVVTPDGREVYVGQLAQHEQPTPRTVYKFISTSPIVPQTSDKFPNNSQTQLTPATRIISAPSENLSSASGGNWRLLFVGGLFISFILVAGFVMWMIARYRKLGCLPMNSRNRRRHAWDFPTVKTDGFKLGNLLERKHGFEKLDQEASDEEPNASTNMISNAQFA